MKASLRERVLSGYTRESGVTADEYSDLFDELTDVEHFAEIGRAVELFKSKYSFTGVVGNDYSEMKVVSMNFDELLEWAEQESKEETL